MQEGLNASKRHQKESEIVLRATEDTECYLWWAVPPSVTQCHVFDFSTVFNPLDITESWNNGVTAGIMGHTWTKGQRD